MKRSLKIKVTYKEMPMDTELRKLHTSQTASLYQGLGQFVADFELLVQQMRSALIFLIAGNNRQDYIQSALAQLTADPMVKVFQATFATAISERSRDKKQLDRGQEILKNVCKRIQTMIADRNEIVHGTWHIGWAGSEDTDFSVANGFKSINSGKGIEHRNISRTKEQFDVLCDTCKQLADLVSRIHAVTLDTKTQNFIDNFVWTEKTASLKK